MQTFVVFTRGRYSKPEEGAIYGTREDAQFHIDKCMMPSRAKSAYIVEREDDRFVRLKSGDVIHIR